MKYITLVSLILISFNLNAQVPVLVKDISPGAPPSMIGPSIAYHGNLIFTVSPGVLYTTTTQLWISDGTSSGTQFLKQFAPWGWNQFCFTLLNDKLYFAASDSTHGEELWVTDGTVAGTQMVLDIFPGGWGGFYGFDIAGVNKFATLGGKLYFVANDSLHGSELWVSDGTAAGTTMVLDINPAPTASGAQGEVVSANGKLYFPADDGVHGVEMWTSDGTAAGTHLVKDLDLIGNDTSTIGNLIVFNNNIYFTENMYYPYDSIYTPRPSRNFCVTDGTVGGTYILDTALGNTVDYAVLGSNLYFVGSGRLWVTDGTASGTRVVKTSLSSTCMPGASSPLLPNSITALNNKLYFYNGGPSSSYQSQIWVSDGTPAGTEKLLVPDSNTTSEVVTYHIIDAKGNLFFVGWDNSNNQWNLWKSDGTAGGTGIVPYSSAKPHFNFIDCDHGLGTMTLVDSVLYFGIEYDSTIGFELYKLAVNVGVPETRISINNFDIYPNPAENKITIASSYPIANVVINNLLGQVVYIQQHNSDKVQIDVSNLPAGIYLIRVNGSEVRKFLKE